MVPSDRHPIAADAPVIDAVGNVGEPTAVDTLPECVCVPKYAEAAASQSDDPVSERRSSLPSVAHPFSNPPSRFSLHSYVDVFGEDRLLLKAGLVLAADAETCANRGASTMPASTWAVGGPFALARRALSISGEGHCLFSLGINLTVTTNVDAEMRALTESGLVTAIIKSTSVRAIVSQGPSADRGRGMVPISDGAVAVIGGAPGLRATVAAFAGLCHLI